MIRLAVVLAAGLAGCASTTPSPTDHEIHGSGPSTVVLSSGYSMPRSTWQTVADELAADHTVFMHDRPGYGNQPDTDRPRDPCTIASDLRAALRTAGLRPPYLLVGHSIGGLYQYTFARLFPREVSGVVLLDPTHPRNWATLQSSQPVLAAAMKAMVSLQPRQALRDEFRQQVECLDRLDALPAPAAPTHLLFSRRHRALEKDYAPALETLQADWPALAGAPATEIVTTILWDSGHHIQTERPDAVARAVRTLTRQAGTSSAATPEVRVGTRAERVVAIGRSRQQEVRSMLGQPDEVHQDGGRTIWVYRAPGIRVPMAASLIPVLGDLADLVELAQSAVERHESIIEFDAQGVVRHARRRAVQD